MREVVDKAEEAEEEIMIGGLAIEAIHDLHLLDVVAHQAETIVAYYQDETLTPTSLVVEVTLDLPHHRNVLCPLLGRALALTRQEGGGTTHLADLLRGEEKQVVLEVDGMQVVVTIAQDPTRRLKHLAHVHLEDAVHPDHLHRLHALGIIAGDTLPYHHLVPAR